MDTETGHGDWMATVAKHKQGQLLRIGRAAADLVARDGLSAVSMAGLARAVGVSRATLYSYVPDVATAIRLYLAAQGDAFYAGVALAVAEETGPEAKLRRYIAEQVTYVAGTDHRVAVALVEAGAALSGPDSASAHQRRPPAVLQDILESGIQAGAFRAGAGAAQAILITRLLYCAHELLHEQQLTQDAAVEAIAGLILDGIRPRPDPA